MLALSMIIMDTFVLWIVKAKEVDNNPVYGLYFTSEGEMIDEGVAEVVDENSDYYGR